MIVRFFAEIVSSKNAEHDRHSPGREKNKIFKMEFPKGAPFFCWALTLPFVTRARRAHLYNKGRQAIGCPLKQIGKVSALSKTRIAKCVLCGVLPIRM